MRGVVDAFGNTTALPAADAGGAQLAATYYTDGTAHTLTQAGHTVTSDLDPAGRTRYRAAPPAAAETLHYSADGDSPSWTVNTNGDWTRNITGMDGLAAIHVGGASPVLQLTNLHGDVIAQAPVDSAATGPGSSADTTEFGVPRSANPPRYSWLGAAQRPTELPSGAITMGARTYVPQLGRFLQPDPVPGGSANAYAYTFGDPVNQADLTGAYTPVAPSWLYPLLNQAAVEAAQAYAAAKAAAEAAQAREAARLAAAAAAASLEDAAIDAWLFGPSGGSIRMVDVQHIGAASTSASTPRAGVRATAASGFGRGLLAACMTPVSVSPSAGVRLRSCESSRPRLP